MITFFNEPKIMAVIADVNQGKSNLVYHIITELQREYAFNLVTYGLKKRLPLEHTIYSVEELESIKDSIIFLDEFYSLFDLDDRKKKQQIEKTFRLIHHNNNILVLVGSPENFKKFISSKIEGVFYKSVRLHDFINGSSVKKWLTNYQGAGMGNELLSIGKDQALYYDGTYTLLHVPYLEEFDSKRANKKILCKKNVGENVQ